MDVRKQHDGALARSQVEHLSSRARLAACVLAIAAIPAAACTTGGGVGRMRDAGPGSGTDAWIPIDPACNPSVDSDGDGVSDYAEGAPTRDTDGDGTPDYLDPNGGLTTGGFAGGACGCRTQTGSSSGTPLLVALGLLLAITRRRARRR